MLEKKVIIIDDDPDYRNSLKGFLNTDSHILICREYDKGKDFINDIHSSCLADVYLIDFQLGDISGIECAKVLKKYNPKSTIIIMSASPDIDSFKEAEQIGVNYIEKRSDAVLFYKKIILS